VEGGGWIIWVLSDNFGSGGVWGVGWGGLFNGFANSSPQTCNKVVVFLYGKKNEFMLHIFELFKNNALTHPPGSGERERLRGERESERGRPSPAALLSIRFCGVRRGNIPGSFHPSRRDCHGCCLVTDL